MSTRSHLLIAGGGLAGGLIALALARHRPEVTVRIIEAGATIGGNHIWSFFDSDVSGEGQALVAPLVCHRWPAYDVAFPAYRRTIRQAYNSIESERFDTVVRAMLPAQCIVRGTIAALDPAGATLADGRRIAADGVIDARGIAAMPSIALGWQKFVGRLLRTCEPHDVQHPVIMDATVDQADGYRFVYLLPFDAHRLFVEDTYYTTGPELDVKHIERCIDAYAAQHGWSVDAVERQEAAALPIAIGGDPAPLIDAGATVAKAGMAAAMFQPMTGYSLPDAVRVALMVAQYDDLTTASLRILLRDHALTCWRQRGYYRLLGRMLFQAARPDERYRMLQRFYALDEGLIGRFYAARSTTWDKARILCGKPPVPLGAAAKVMLGAG